MSGCTTTSIDRDVASIFDPFGNAVHTALSFPVLGEDVLITGAGPIGIMAAAVVRHAGARYVVVTDVNPYRLGTGQEMGATLAVDVRDDTASRTCRSNWTCRRDLTSAWRCRATRPPSATCSTTCATAARSPCSGFPTEEMAIDWSTVVFNMLTIKGIYGREMYETWYKMTVMLESGLDISPIITHRFHYTEFQKGFDVMRSGQSGKVILSWQ